MNVLLINPQIAINENVCISQTHDCGEHIGLQLIASYLRQCHHIVSVEYVDAGNLSTFGFRCILRGFHDIVGISVMSQTYPLSISIADHIKQLADIPIVVGGILPTILQERFLDEFDPDSSIDFLVYGDGEEALAELLFVLEEGNSSLHHSLENIQGLIWRDGGRIRKNLPRRISMNIDQFPFASRDYAKEIIEQFKKNQIQPSLRVITSRGCLSKCLFCHIREYYECLNLKPTWRHRSAENIVDELSWLSTQYRVNHFLFSDDNFFGYGKIGHERALSIADLIIKRRLNITFCIQSRFESVDRYVFERLKKAGLVSVDLGVESINQDTLSFFNKKLTLDTILEVLSVLASIKGVAIGLYFLNIHPLSSIKETFDNYQFLKATGYLDRSPFERDREIYRKLIASACEVTKYTRMYYKFKEIGVLGGPYSNNPVMYNFAFKNRHMYLFYNDINQYVDVNGLNGFQSCFEQKIKSYLERENHENKGYHTRRIN